jgi:enamine deaminase RidA (YjgF/YER057c/UK114 family)
MTPGLDPGAAKATEVVRIPEPTGRYPWPTASTFNGLSFSTHIALREDGSIVEGDFREQAQAALDTMRRGLEQAGSDLSRLLHVTVYLTDMEDNAVFEELWAQTVPQPWPGQCTIGVAALGLPSMRIEITVIAALRDGAR